MDSLAHILLHSSRRESESINQWASPLSPAQRLLRCDWRDGKIQVVLRSPGKPNRAWLDPLEALQWMAASAREEEGRWVGFLAYDLVRFLEADAIPALAQDDLKLPLFAFTWHEKNHPVVAPFEHSTHAAPLASTFSRVQYMAAVRRIIRYIKAGDVFQANLSQRFSTGLKTQPFEVFNRLTERAPALYGAYLDYGDFALISNSPELFLRVTPDRQITTRPIKGTRPRIAGLEVELLRSPKDQAELNMIIDVERNDLGRICEIGTVKVVEPRTIEAHPTVFHGVASISGTLRASVSFVNILRATFPSGSVTGAPKIRAMQIIEEIEPVRRGCYCGAIGYLDSNGQLEFNVAIRTMILKDGIAHVPVGGGIVSDSDPAAEYEETLVKARAMFEALNVVL